MMAYGKANEVLMMIDGKNSPSCSVKKLDRILEQQSHREYLFAKERNKGALCMLEKKYP